MRVVFHDYPEKVLSRLRAPHPDTWVKVLIGETETVVSITEYVHKLKFEAVEEVLTELVKFGSLPIFVAKPERMKPHIRKAVKVIVEVMQEGK